MKKLLLIVALCAYAPLQAGKSFEELVVGCVEGTEKIGALSVHCIFPSSDLNIDALSKGSQTLGEWLDDKYWTHGRGGAVHMKVAEYRSDFENGLRAIVDYAGQNPTKENIRRIKWFFEKQKNGDIANIVTRSGNTVEQELLTMAVDETNPRQCIFAQLVLGYAEPYCIRTSILKAQWKAHIKKKNFVAIVCEYVMKGTDWDALEKAYNKVQYNCDVLGYSECNYTDVLGDRLDQELTSAEGFKTMSQENWDKYERVKKVLRLFNPDRTLRYNDFTEISAATTSFPKKGSGNFGGSSSNNKRISSLGKNIGIACVAIAALLAVRYYLMKDSTDDQSVNKKKRRAAS